MRKIILISTILVFFVAAAYAQAPDSCELRPVQTKAEGRSEFASFPIDNAELENDLKHNGLIVKISDLEKLADGGDANSQGRLSGIFFHGSGGRGCNWLASAKWTTPLAEKGDTESIIRLVKIYETGGNGIEKNIAEAAKWRVVLATGGSVESQIWLANLYKTGAVGVARDDAESYFWSSLAAENNNDEAKTLRDELADKLTKQQLDVVDGRLESWRFRPLLHFNGVYRGETIPSSPQTRDLKTTTILKISLGALFLMVTAAILIGLTNRPNSDTIKLTQRWVICEAMMLSLPFAAVTSFPAILIIARNDSSGAVFGLMGLLDFLVLLAPLYCALFYAMFFRRLFALSPAAPKGKYFFVEYFISIIPVVLLLYFWGFIQFFLGFMFLSPVLWGNTAAKKMHWLFAERFFRLPQRGGNQKGDSSGDVWDDAGKAGVEDIWREAFTTLSLANACIFMLMLFPGCALFWGLMMWLGPRGSLLPLFGILVVTNFLLSFIPSMTLFGTYQDVAEKPVPQDLCGAF